MTALAADRNTPALRGDLLKQAMAASALVYAGSLVVRNATGYLVKGTTTTGQIGVGRAEERVDNSGGADGAKLIMVRPGIFRFGNSASTDALTIADIGKACWVVDDQTVARTSNTSARSKAGVVRDVDAQGVWVELNEALTRVATVTAA
ncbi:MAG: hypothetical protein ACOH2H_15345 [Cypionkella sp.]